MPFKTIVTELLWFLQGNTNIKYLVDNNCHIWDGDAYKNFVTTVEKNRTEGYTREVMTQDEFITNIKIDPDFAKEWGDLGPIYGKQWRGWNSIDNSDFDMRMNVYEIDQIARLINDLKTNPDSRRLMVNAWNVGELDKMVLPPCHYVFQVYTRELSLEERLDLASKTYDVFDPLDFSIPAKVDHDEIDKLYPVPKRAISLMWNQRSVDTFLGLPFNIASYGLLLILIAREVNMIPENLIGNLGDTHLYLNHLEQAEEQMSREPFELPKIEILESNISEGEFEFNLVGYQSYSQIKAPLSN
jgi:thymidylate synthase